MSKKINSILIFISVSLLTSCATQKPKPVVYAPPHIELPPDPIPATNKVTDASPPADVMKSWVSTAFDLRGWNIAVRKLVENSR
jgi:hypothetical protein